MAILARQPLYPKQSPLMRVVGGVDVERERQKDLSTQQHHQQRRLTASEKRIARWLKGQLGFIGAETFVREFGVRLILEKLHDGVVEWWDAPGNVVGTASGWRVRSELRQPAGFLRWLVSR